MKKCKVWQSKQEFFIEHMMGEFTSNPSNTPRFLNEYELTFETNYSGNILDILNDIYDLLNQDDRPTGQISHSLSMGDLIQINDDFYAIKSLGFAKVDVVA